jgi:hypothetical protein
MRTKNKPVVEGVLVRFSNPLARSIDCFHQTYHRADTGSSYAQWNFAAARCGALQGLSGFVRVYLMCSLALSLGLKRL